MTQPSARARARLQPHFNGAGEFGTTSCSIPAEIGLLEQAVEEDRRVTFHFVARAWFRICDTSLSDDQRARFRELSLSW